MDAKTKAQLPREVRLLLREAANLWLNSDSRPRVRPDVRSHWKRLVREWIADRRMPLLVRGFCGVGKRLSATRYASR